MTVDLVSISAGCALMASGTAYRLGIRMMLAGDAMRGRRALVGDHLRLAFEDPAAATPTDQQALLDHLS